MQYGNGHIVSWDFLIRKIAAEEEKYWLIVTIPRKIILNSESQGKLTKKPSPKQIDQKCFSTQIHFKRLDSLYVYLVFITWISSWSKTQSSYFKKWAWLVQIANWRIIQLKLQLEFKPDTPNCKTLYYYNFRVIFGGKL